MRLNGLIDADMVMKMSCQCVNVARKINDVTEKLQML